MGYRMPSIAGIIALTIGWTPAPVVVQKTGFIVRQKIIATTKTLMLPASISVNRLPNSLAMYSPLIWKQPEAATTRTRAKSKAKCFLALLRRTAGGLEDAGLTTVL
ncbi:Uncharacterised protein [uncultured archaeon]|nr:Uncharacterised protein [uncultured archaeon]